MALSDWDSAAWDRDGRPCVGDVMIGDTTRLSISKSHIVVEDDSLWNEGGVWSKPTTILVVYRDQPGLHVVGGIRILTAEAPQSGVFFLAASGEGDGLRLHGGIGVSGYDFAFDLPGALCARYGISPAKFGYRGGRGSTWDRETGLRREHLSGRDFDLIWWQGAYERDRPPQDMIYFGVKPETYEAFMAWAESVAADGADPLRTGRAGLENWISRVREAGCLRVNQGDVFMAAALMGPDVDVRSSPGECAVPIAASMMPQGRRVATSLPYRSHSQWAEARRKLVEEAGLLRPGMMRLKRPVAARRIAVKQARN